jgi:hypothetical protein
MKYINVPTRLSAETKRLLRAIRSMQVQDDLGRGKAYEVYMQQARTSAAIIIGKVC